MAEVFCRTCGFVAEVTGVGCTRQVTGSVLDMASICVRRFGKAQPEPERFDCADLIASIEWAERDRHIKAMLAAAGTPT